MLRLTLKNPFPGEVFMLLLLPR